MRATTWLRVSYWTGAIVDALAAIQLMVPSIFAATYRVPDVRLGVGFIYASGMAASLMLGWTCLLLWADRKPFERKGILLFTVIPVIFGFVFYEIWAVDERFFSSEAIAPIWILQAALVALFLFSYLNARKVEFRAKQLGTFR